MTDSSSPAVSRGSAIFSETVIRGFAMGSLALFGWSSIESRIAISAIKGQMDHAAAMANERHAEAKSEHADIKLELSRLGDRVLELERGSKGK